jgi:prevent-host-death family protein
MREPRTQVIEATEAQARWSQLLHGVLHGEIRVVVNQDGVPIAAVISARDLERLTQLERERAERFAVVEEIRDRNEDRDHQEAERDVAAEIAAMRDERRVRAATPTG